MKQTDFAWMKTLGAVASIGFLIMIATGIGLLFGLWLARVLGTGPWLVLIFTLMGLAAGLIEAVKILIKVGR